MRNIRPTAILSNAQAVPELEAACRINHGMLLGLAPTLLACSVKMI